MGCVCSRKLSVETNEKPLIFKVVNVDQELNGSHRCKIGLTSDNLILYQTRKAPLTWPIRSLRRFGGDNEIFTFEVGRRCPTGEGIFAFRCKEADQLMKSLQANIQKTSHNVLLSLADNNHRVNGLEIRTMDVRNRLESVGSASVPHTPVSQPSISSTCLDAHDPYIKIDLETKAAPSQNSTASSSPVYINVPVDEPISENTPYICSTQRNNEKQYPPALVWSTDGSSGDTEPSLNKIQYTLVDFNDAAPVNLHFAESERAKLEYVMIDLPRTEALSKIKKDRDWQRRTRYNGNISKVG